jgi:PhnB protein
MSVSRRHASSSVVDPFGHRWSIATHQRDMTPEQMQAAMQEAMTKGQP